VKIYAAAVEALPYLKKKERQGETHFAIKTAVPTFEC
jgi:hypothetical protein